MPPLDIRQCVEVFHVVLLDFLGRKLDKRFVTLKGGCNLRFFHRSPRYSDDMDLDVEGLGKEKVEAAVGGILESASFAQVLRFKGISIVRSSAPKQTDTTQRWKIALAAPSAPAGLHTKVEFSRRGRSGTTAFGPIDPQLAACYELAPVMTSHYDGPTACAQKVQALASRAETQARDVFDLHLLIASGAAGPHGAGLPRAKIAAAADRAMSVSFAVFKSQVLSYLHPDSRLAYDSEDAWHDMVLRVVEHLESAGDAAAAGATP